jgi:hypothetical protein
LHGRKPDEADATSTARAWQTDLMRVIRFRRQTTRKVAVHAASGDTTNFKELSPLTFLLCQM